MASIKWLSIDGLELWPRNYRKGEVGAIRDSIERFGFNGALRVWNGRVMAGNHSLLALRALKGDGGDAPANVKVSSSGDWSVPAIDISHLSETEAEAFGIADNSLQDLATQDDDLLRQIVADIEAFDPGLIEITGLDLESIEPQPAPQPIAGEGGAGGTEPLSFLRWGKHQVQLTAEEETALSEAYERHLEDTGTGFGFARKLLRL